NNRDVRVIFLHKFKLEKTAVKTAENINLAFEEGCANVRTLHRCRAKFKIGDFSLKMSQEEGQVGSSVITKYETVSHPPLFTKSSPTDSHFFRQLDNFFNKINYVEMKTL
ncbi:hypothetical protein WH47_05327, partial [Habropoda laboriosa]